MNGAPYWFPVVTLLIGAAIAYLVDHVRESRAAERERDTGRRAFERETLIALQDCLSDLGRAAGQIHFADYMAREAGAPSAGRQQVPREANDAFATATRDVHRLKVRLADEDLRAKVSAFAGLCAAVALPEPGTPPDKHWRDSNGLMGSYVALNDLLGERIRAVL